MILIVSLILDARSRLWHSMSVVSCSKVAPSLSPQLPGRKPTMSKIVLVTANIRALGISNKVCCKKKLKVVLNHLPDLVILTEVCVTIRAWIEWWTKNRFELSKYTGEFLENGRRGIIAMVKKPLKFVLKQNS